MPDDFNFGADLFGAPDPFGDPFQEAGDQFKMGWEYPNSPNLNEQNIFDIYEKQFDTYGFLDIHDILFNPSHVDPPPLVPPELDLKIEEWVRPDQLGDSMNEIPQQEMGGINDFIEDAGDGTRTVSFGRTKSFFGRRPKTFWDRMESLLKRVDVANTEDITFKEIDEEESDDVSDEENNEQEDEATGEQSPDDENE